MKKSKRSKPNKVCKGVKHDDNKLRWSLLPWKSLEEVVRILEFGANKYTPDNWKLVDDGYTRYINASLRHIIETLTGSAVDSESGYLHLSHSVCSLLFAIEFLKKDTKDD